MKPFCQNLSHFTPKLCFRCRTLAALVIIFLTIMCRLERTSCAPYSPTTGTRRDRAVQCSVQQDKSFSFRSQCQDNGFLTVLRNKVFVQTSGLSHDHEDGEYWVLAGDLCAVQLSLCIFYSCNLTPGFLFYFTWKKHIFIFEYFLEIKGKILERTF